MTVRILLVDDSQVLTDLFQVQLQNLGNHGLVISKTKQAALAALEREGPFDMAFIDMSLEGQEYRGLQILAEARARFPHLKLVVLSANDQREVVTASMKAGAQFYMLKPFTTEGLRLVLANDMSALQEYQPDIGEGRIFVFGEPKKLIKRLKEKKDAES